MKKFMKSKLIPIPIFILLIFSPIIIIHLGLLNSTKLQIGKNSDNIEIGKCPKASDYDPNIIIIGNQDFHNQAEGKWDEGGERDGTKEKPYVIKDLNISSSNTHGISIQNTDVYFIIKNVTVSGGYYYLKVGFYLINIKNGELINNTVNSAYYGFYLDLSDNNILINNTAKYNQWHAFSLRDSTNNTLTGNIAMDNNYIGLNLQRSNNNTLEGNIANYNMHGLILDESSNNTLTSNTVEYNSQVGFSLPKSSNNNLTGNTANYNNLLGFMLDGSSNNNLTGNTANYNNDAGFWLQGSSYNNFLTGNTANYNNIRGFMLSNSNKSTLMGNTADYNTQFGFYFYKSSNNNLTGNNADYNTQFGFMLYYSDKNTLTGNIANNNKNGFYIKSFDNIFYGNIIKNNSIGLMFNDNSCENIIYNNYLMNNSLNAQDNGTNNQWDNGLIGNYYDDYNGFDFDGDNIGDIPYNISGTANSKDYRPIGGYPCNLPFLNIKIVNQTFTNEIFNITLFIFNFKKEGIQSAIFNIWWNGTNVSDKIQNLTGGYFQICLSPITILAGEAPILLNMTISAENYFDLYYELYIAVEREIAPEIYSIDIDIIEQFYAEDWFNFTFYVYNASNHNQGIEGVIWEISWDGMVVTGDIVPLENGYYSISLEPLKILPGENPICLNGTISIIGFDPKEFEFYIAVEEEVETEIYILSMEILEQFFSEDVFNITIYVYNTSNYNQGIVADNIDVWWNGTQLSINNITSLGGGNYSISLKPILVQLGEDPILLQITISDSDFDEILYFKIYILVDPELVDKTPEPGPSPPSDGGGDGKAKKVEEPAIPIILLVVIGVGSAIGASSITIFILKKRNLSKREI